MTILAHFVLLFRADSVEWSPMPNAADPVNLKAKLSITSIILVHKYSCFFYKHELCGEIKGG